MSGSSILASGILRFSCRRDANPVNEYTIDAKWDSAAGVWVATSESVPGVAVEARTSEEIVEILTDALPDLFRHNGIECRGDSVSIVFNTRVETVRLAPAA